MATIKSMLQTNTADIIEATELLKVLSDREGQFVWKQLTAEGGDFVAFVTADDENSYPDKGTQDGYWYELVEEGVNLAQMFGCSKIAVDTFLLSSPKDAQSTTLNHSLNVKPRVVMIINPKFNGETTALASLFAMKKYSSYNNAEGILVGGHSVFTPGNDGGLSSKSTISTAASEITTTTVKFNDIANGAFFSANTEYFLITMA